MKMSYWLAIILLVGCDDPGSIEQIEATAPTDGLQLTAVVTPSSFAAGQLTQVTVTLVNQGIHTWLVPDNHCRDAFEISTQNAEVVRPPQFRVCTMELLPPQPLRPSSQIEYKATWTGGTSANGPLSLGTYLVGGNVYVYRGTRHLNLRGGGTLFQIVN